MKFDKTDLLREFVQRVDEHLKIKINQIEVQYPEKAISEWDVDNIATANEGLLSSVSGVANIYALFVAESGSNEFTLKYIGKTTQKLARQRLRNHLIKKHSDTGAKLDLVKSAVKYGSTIKVSYTSIEPESLRNYVEEELIKLNSSANWNRENAKLSN